jgi:Rrf2 family protein
MKLSTKARYGTRLMVDLAAGYGRGPIVLKSISAEQVLSKKYLEQITQKLRSNGLVKTVRGVKGGYFLSRPPAEITLLEVVEAIDGPLELVRCVGEDRVCPRAATCVTRDVWSDLVDGLKVQLGSISLEELVRKSAQKAQVRNG